MPSASAPRGSPSPSAMSSPPGPLSREGEKMERADNEEGVYAGY